MDVTDVLRGRMHETDGLQRMALVSFVAHGLVVAALVFAPGGWLSQQEAPVKTVMTISLGGGNGGPASGGYLIYFNTGNNAVYLDDGTWLNGTIGGYGTPKTFQKTTGLWVELDKQ